MDPVSTLLYGGPGVGKTALAISSFWDFLKEEPVPGREGRWILVGQESNPALAVPEEFIKRFPIPANNPFGFVAELDLYTKALVSAAAKKGNKITDIVFDGWTEFCRDYVWAHEIEKGSAGTWDPYRDWVRDFTSIIQRLSPRVLNANVFGTARVAEFRKAGKTASTNKEVKGDPEWMSEFKYHPSMEGQIKHQLPHYFNFVIYMDKDYKMGFAKGKETKTEVFKSHWVATGDYSVKNILGHKWGEEPEMVDVQWPEVMAKLEAL